MLKNKTFNIKVKKVSTANIAPFTEYIVLYDKEKNNLHKGEHKPDTTTKNTNSPTLQQYQKTHIMKL